MSETFLSTRPAMPGMPGGHGDSRIAAARAAR